MLIIIICHSAGSMCEEAREQGKQALFCLSPLALARFQYLSCGARCNKILIQLREVL